MDPRPTFRGPSGGGPAEDARREVEEELAFHLEAMEEALVEGGMRREDARAEALRRFGDLDATRRYCEHQQTRRHRTRGWTMTMDALRHDLKLALRTLRRSPGYSAVVVLTLAVGITATTVIFSILNPYFLRPLPFADADRLVQVGQVQPRYDWDGARFSLRMLADYEARVASLQALGAYHYGSDNLTGPEGSELVGVGYMTGDMFGVLGVEALRGRTFGPEADGPGGDDVVVVGHGLWQRRWGGDPGLVGSTVEMDGVRRTVVGVMPPDFNFPYGEVEMWLPVGEDPATEARDHTAHIMVGRLAEGWTPAEARAELEAVQRQLAARWPDVDGQYAGISVKPVREALNFVWDEMRMALSVLLVAVVLVLGIACVNVAGLTLARAHRRSRDVAVRAALGAGRGHIVRHLVAESAVLAVVGGVLGVAATWAATSLIDPLIPAGIFKVGGVTVDGTVLLFSSGVTLATVLLFGLAPAVRVARSDIASLVRAGSGGGGPGALRGRRWLVVGEIAMAIVLVVGTGLMIRSVVELERTDLGYDARRLLAAEVIPPEAEYPDGAEMTEYFRRAEEELRAVPGVADVGQVYPLPMNHEAIPVQLARPGREPADENAWPTALIGFASDTYFDAAGVPVLTGRPFAAEDRDGPPVAVIDRRVAEEHFGADDPVGRTLVLGEDRLAVTVVGVVGSIRHSGFTAAQGAQAGGDPMVYRPLSQSPRRRRFMVARTEGEPASLVGPAREALRRVDGDLSVNLRPAMDVVRENTFQWTVSSAFLGVFGIVAVGLAVLGIYGLVSYSVAQRTRELGVRVAMGAGRSDIRRLVLGEGVRIGLAGGALGMAAALLLGRVAGAFLYRVDPWDPGTLAGVTGLFALVVLAATLLPARRATRVDPVRVLREE